MKDAPDPKLTPGEARRIASDGFVFGFPPTLVDIVRRTHPVAANQVLHLQNNSAAIAPGLEEEDFRIARTSAWIDVSDGPVAVNLPDLQGRHFSVVVYDAWGQIIGAGGSRTQPDAPFELTMAGPQWEGGLPGAAATCRSPTNLAWMVTRVAAHTPADREIVRGLLSEQSVTPVDIISPRHTPQSAFVEPPARASRESVGLLGPDRFFHRLAMLLDRYPPDRDDQAVLRDLARIGVTPGRTYHPPIENEPIREAIARGVADGLAKIQYRVRPDPSPRAGWRPIHTGPADTSPLARACSAYSSLGAPAKEDVLHLVCEADDEGRPLRGSERYVLHFPRGGTPPVDDFWNLALRPSPRSGDLTLRRHTLGDRDGLAPDRHGALDVLMQHPAPPLSHVTNWLPAPPGEFALVLRLHGPRAAALTGTWRPPGVGRVEPSRRLRRKKPRPGEGAFQ